MPGNWMDDRERQIRERDARGASDYRGERRRDQEDRSWDRDDRPDMYGARRGSPERAEGHDRVFGERESGASYGRADPRGPQAYGGGSAARGWQDRNYRGVSPAMRQGEYEDEYGRDFARVQPDHSRPRFSHQDYTREDYRSGGRYLGDDDRERIYREEYGQGGVEYGDVPRGYDAGGGYSPTRERYHAEGYGQPGFGSEGADDRREMNRASSGGTGGYDYERGYGDAGRREDQEGRDSRGERFEDAGRNAGDFLHRAGQRVASWFNGGGEGRINDPHYLDPNSDRGKRGLGPQGYKRSDDRIDEDAHERLTDDTWLDASNISISVSGGEVTLAGTVESREAKHRAERLVEDISGVNHVQNNLRIAKGGFLTSPSAGYGDSVVDAQMRRDEPAATGSGGAGGGQSTAGRKS
jgi:osmotically-inducible protein OsmY